MLLPAAVFGYFVLFLSLDRAYDIFNRLPRGYDMLLHHKLEVLEATLLRFGGYAADWVIYCFAFAGVAVAVDELEAGKQPSVEACFTGARDRLLRFFGLSLALFGVCLAAIVLWEVLLLLFVARLGPTRVLTNPLISLGIFFVPIWAVSVRLSCSGFCSEKSLITKALFVATNLQKAVGRFSRFCSWKALAALICVFAYPVVGMAGSPPRYCAIVGSKRWLTA